ncbi:YdeI/OmpD-associated family protein [Vannielia litorea]|nr:YdeI/OmpD-associated family protein [Vannielia litorea]MBY6047399.1 YdeI/OmpD-associated family protein [Vannielia litorea]MBY6074813.1 YdeI/OmpD-associated family protein [Vannielia litorea]
MPADVRAELAKHGLLARYGAAPAERRMSYLARIEAARQGPARAARIEQMIEALKRG